MSLTIHSIYKYFDSTVQRAEDRGQKFHFCRLPFAVNVMLNLSISEVKFRGNSEGISEVFREFRVFRVFREFRGNFRGISEGSSLFPGEFL